MHAFKKSLLMQSGEQTRKENTQRKRQAHRFGQPWQVTSILGLGVSRQTAQVKARRGQEESSADGWHWGRQTCPSTSRRPTFSPDPCRPGLESTHSSLHAGQEAEALVGDAGAEAAVQGEQGLGALLRPVPLQPLPAQLLQQDLGAEAWARGRPGMGARGQRPTLLFSWGLGILSSSQTIYSFGVPRAPATPALLHFCTTQKDHGILSLF